MAESSLCLSFIFCSAVGSITVPECQVQEVLGRWIQGQEDPSVDFL